MRVEPCSKRHHTPCDAHQDNKKTTNHLPVNPRLSFQTRFLCPEENTAPSPGTVEIHREYLLCLLDADGLHINFGLVTIPHGRSRVTYECLLNGQEPPPVAPAKRKLALEDEMEDELWEPEPPAPFIIAAIDDAPVVAPEDSVWKSWYPENKS